MYGMLIIILMMERARQLEYSSLVMGSKDVPSVSFPTKRISHLLSTKTFSKKSELLSVKYTKGRSNRIRTRNERPDIFLEGEQLCQINLIYHREMDLRYLEKARKSTPQQPKPEIAKPIPRTIIDSNCWTSLDEEATRQALLNIPNVARGHSNTIFRSNLRSNPLPQSTERQRTQGKDFSRGKRDLRLRVEQRIDIRKEQSEKEKERDKLSPDDKRKQLFYINQKDLTGIRTDSFIVVEYPANQIVTGYYYKKVAEIASLTKIMTFYASLRLLIQFDVNPDQEIVQIDEKVVEISGTSAELYEGDRFTIMQLFHALMLPSGNDAALALARWGGALLGEGPKAFIALMNKIATEIGMKSTTFGNAHGLPHPQNGSTAQDVSTLISRCLEHSLFKEVIKCKQYKCVTENSGKKREVVWQNTNKLLRRPGFEGVKTGVTTTAGPCLATLYTVNNRCFIVVLLRTSKLSRRFKQTRWILSMCLKKLGTNEYNNAIRELNRTDTELDSDNSEDQEEFNFERNDAFEFERRKRILLNEL